MVYYRDEFSGCSRYNLKVYACYFVGSPAEIQTIQNNAFCLFSDWRFVNQESADLCLFMDNLLPVVFWIIGASRIVVERMLYFGLVMLLYRMTSPNRNLFRVTGPLWGNPPVTGEQTVEQTIETPVIWDAGDLRRYRAHHDVTVMNAIIEFQRHEVIFVAKLYIYTHIKHEELSP